MGYMVASVGLYGRVLEYMVGSVGLQGGELGHIVESLVTWWRVLDYIIVHGGECWVTRWGMGITWWVVLDYMVGSVEVHGGELGHMVGSVGLHGDSPFKT